MKDTYRGSEHFYYRGGEYSYGDDGWSYSQPTLGGGMAPAANISYDGMHQVGYHYNYSTHKYHDNSGGAVSFFEVNNNFVLPNLLLTLNGPAAQEYAGALRSGSKNAYNSKLIAGPGITLEDGPGWEAIKMLWNLKIIGGSIPDNISFDLTLGSVFGIGKSETFSINFLTKGDAGFYLTRTEQTRGGAEIDWGLNINFGYYTGDPLNINNSSLLGPVRSVSGGWIYSGNISAGYSNSNFGRPSWITGGTGIGLTGGGSYGWGKTYKGWLGY